MKFEGRIRCHGGVGIQTKRVFIVEITHKFLTSFIKWTLKGIAANLYHVLSLPAFAVEPQYIGIITTEIEVVQLNGHNNPP